MLKLSASLGLKYFRSSKGAFVSFTSIMAIIGLTIGVAALIIVTSVMNGFEKELREADCWRFIDNSTDCYGFVRGSHKNGNVAGIIKRVILNM